MGHSIFCLLHSIFCLLFSVLFLVVTRKAAKILCNMLTIIYTHGYGNLEI